MLLLLLFALTLGHGARPEAPLPRRGTSLRAEVAALLHWKSTLKGFSQHQLGTWRHDIHPCNWTGITCGDVPWRQRRHGRTTARNAITGIALPGAHLVGGLDTLSFRSFPYLASLDLSDNGHLSGTIPPGISSLLMLSSLNLSSNQLTGNIPPSIGDLGRISSIDLSYNNLTGEIPPALGNLTKLTYLSLLGNKLSGNIPWQLGKLLVISFIDLSLYLLFGPILSLF